MKLTLIIPKKMFLSASLERAEGNLKKEVHSLENPAFMLFEVWKTPDLTQKEVFLSTQNIKEVAWDKICDIYRSQIASSSKLQER